MAARGDFAATISFARTNWKSRLPVGDVVQAVFDVGDTFSGDRVGEQPGGDVTGDQTGAALHTLEKGGHGVWVEPGFLQRGEADAICFPLICPGKVQLSLHAACPCADDSGLRGLRVGAGGENGDCDGGHRGQRIDFLVGHHARQMVLGDVGNFMCQHRGELGFALGKDDQASIDPDKTARQREGIDVVVVDGEEFELLAGVVAVGCQPVTQAVEIVVDLTVTQVVFVGAYPQHALFADLALLLRRKCCLGCIAEIGQAVRAGEERKA